MPSKPAKTQEQTFETAIDRLEAIVNSMEGEKLPLEDLIDLYEEGAKLVKTCQEKLDAAEKRIEIISRSASGKPQLTEFNASGQAGAPTRNSSESDSGEAILF